MASHSAEDRLWTIAKQLQQTTNVLVGIVEGLALSQLKVSRTLTRKTLKELQLANKDRRMLRKELLTLHKLLNEEVKDMSPHVRKGKFIK